MRDEAITAFLATQPDWRGAARHAIAGDASRRRYTRLIRPDGTSAILMDAPKEAGEDVRPFLHIAGLLRQAGLSAPGILAQDIAQGVLLIEDLGDGLFARILAQNPARGQMLYQAATDVLVHLHRQTPPDLHRYDCVKMAELAALSVDWYTKGIAGTADAESRAGFIQTLQNLLEPLDHVRPVMILRDYHAENLLWLPDRPAPANVGLLDFQDAMLGHPAYDLVSVLRDARRDVAPRTESEMLAHYIAATGAEPEAFTAAYELLALQRNLRILGVFARLSLAYGRPHYVDLIPRVWTHIERALRAPAIAPHAITRLRSVLPSPTPSRLESLKAQCSPCPLA